MKRWIISLLIVTFVFVGTFPCIISAADQITLRIFWWGSQTRHDRTLKVLEMYEAKNPGVKFQAEFSGFNEYFEKLNTLVASQDMPDVFQIGNNLLTYKDHLLPLDPFIEKGIIDVKNTTENFVDSARIGGQILGINLGSNAHSLLYDPELFKQAGVAEPTAQWTWQDFETAALTFKEKLGIFGVSDLADNAIGGWVYIPQHGKDVDIFNVDGTALGYADDKFLEDFFAMKLRLIKAGAAPTPAEWAQVKDIQGDFLVYGKAAMTLVWSNTAVAAMNAAKRPLKLATLPKLTPDGLSGMFPRASMHFAIPKTAKNPEESAKFINYFINDVEANQVLMADRGVPIMANVRAAIKPLMSEQIQLTFDHLDVVGKIASKKQPIEPPGQLELESVIRKIGEEVYFEKISPAEAAAKFRKQATEVLTRTAKK